MGEAQAVLRVPGPSALHQSPLPLLPKVPALPARLVRSARCASTSGTAHPWSSSRGPDEGRRGPRRPSAPAWLALPKPRGPRSGWCSQTGRGSRWRPCAGWQTPRRGAPKARVRCPAARARHPRARQGRPPALWASLRPAGTPRVAGCPRAPSLCPEQRAARETFPRGTVWAPGLGF